ncbi:hypothetical protein ACMYUM_27350 (plasmid) [Priestia megaterium]|uniref:hypothetical protein n=1 Tax=Priestia TaxID=2800373 RepID=UPI00196A6DFF|nr:MULTISPECIES: hypothetical protein [Priestia]MCW1048975.1 hypothetical protein [Priestia sp. JV24]QSF42075.1 hypothetical protein ICR96_29375 [Priestia megaterium]
MGANLSFQLANQKWLEIRRGANGMVEIKVCPDAVLEPADSFCHITEKEFIEIVMKGLGERLKVNNEIE